MTYEAWRITYQSSEQAARAAYAIAEELGEKLRIAEQRLACSLFANVTIRKAELAASQYREAQLREALDVLVFQHHDWGLGDVCSATFAQQNRELIQNARKALALPQDTSALEALIAKAGEAMRSQALLEFWCPFGAEVISTDQVREKIRALPGMTLEDLQK